MNDREIRLPIKLTTIYPILNLGQNLLKGFDILVKELTETNKKFYLPLNIFGNIYLKFSFESKINFIDFTKNDKTELYLIIESDIEININKTYELIASNSNLSLDVKPEHLVLGYFRIQYNSQLKNFLKFTQISYPGTLWLDNGFVYIYNKKTDNVEGISSILSESFYYDEQWPEKINIEIIQVWEYVLNKTNLLEKFSSTRIERAICSFTHLFSKNYHEDIPISLFWALSGLEALFVEGEVGITQQLNDKIQVFLGELIDNKKRLKNLYNFRSSLIHGVLSIPMKDAIIDDEKHLDDLYKMNTFAATILVTSLQKIIQTGLTELKFVYTY